MFEKYAGQTPEQRASYKRNETIRNTSERQSARIRMASKRTALLRHFHTTRHARILMNGKLKERVSKHSNKMFL